MKNREIQGLRGLCVLMVFFSHSFGIIPFVIRIGNIDLSISPFRSLWDGQIAVVIFFILSGYFSYATFFNINGTSFFKKYINFIIKRMLRLYPIYILVMAIGFIMSNINITYEYTSFSEWFNSFWRNKVTIIEFLKQVFPIISFNSKAINPPIWTLQVEFRYLLIMPLFFIFIKRYNSIFSLTIIALLSYSLGIFNLLYIFAIGMIIKKEEDKITKVFYEKNIYNKIFLVFISILLLGFQYNFHYIASKMNTNNIMFIVSIGGSILMLLILSLLKNGIKISFLNNVFMVGLGNISYSFYLWHFIVLLSIRPLYKFINNYFIYIALAFFITLFLSFITEKINYFCIIKIKETNLERNIKI
ncbi:MAG: acyltransferase [Clostridium sp.]|jgi:peptidoglycan/LPS O-acetylase OafA/YrhL|uniref:acyltransferase family protein n=1 Tax=Clostridium sp. TaxID=1506 RepID=UPI00290C3AD0|nr:acyltransferase [Clostridium sp.]MDU7947255.1 acyltransferase [Clostridium sp.]